MGMNSFDHLCRDVIFLAFLYERSFETRVTEDLLQSSAALSSLMHDTGSTEIVRYRGNHNHNGNEKSHGVHNSKGLPTRYLLACIISPGGTGHRCGTSYTTSIDYASRWVGISSLFLPNHFNESFSCSLPGSVLRPLHVIAMHRIPVGVVRRQSPPLTTCRIDIEDCIYDVPLPSFWCTTYATVSAIDREEITDEIPLLIG